jgi:hypothetical protein
VLRVRNDDPVACSLTQVEGVDVTIVGHEVHKTAVPWAAVAGHCIVTINIVRGINQSSNWCFVHKMLKACMQTFRYTRVCEKVKKKQEISAATLDRSVMHKDGQECLLL